jgi:hypothetical protein
MFPQLTMCDACGQQANLIETYGLLEPNPAMPGVRVVQLIDCPFCGQREQPDGRMPMEKSFRQGTTPSSQRSHHRSPSPVLE